MYRTLADIRENMDYVGCDNSTASDLCDEVERLRAALRSILKHMDDNGMQNWSCAKMARKALKE